MSRLSKVSTRVRVVYPDSMMSRKRIMSKSKTFVVGNRVSDFRPRSLSPVPIYPYSFAQIASAISFVPTADGSLRSALRS